MILEFAEIRLAIEPAAASLAARTITDDALAEMPRAIDRMSDAAHDDDEPLESDIAVHVAVLKANQNRFFWSLRYMIEVALRFSIRITNQRKGVDRANVDDYRRILDAIAARDQNAAEALMRSLLLESKMLLYGAQAPKDGAALDAVGVPPSDVSAG